MRILLASPIAPPAIAEMRSSHDVVLGFEMVDRLHVLIEDRQVLVFRSGVDVSASLMGAAPDLELLIRAGSGFDNLDLDHCRDRGIRVVRVPGPSSQAVAEFTMGLILALSRRITEADANMQVGRWPKHDLKGRLITGKTLGVVGAGRIGKRVGEMGALLGMQVLACVERPEEERDFAARGITLTDFDTVVERADVLSVHTPLNEKTTWLIDDSVFERMRPGAFLINTARGGVVDESALIGALDEGKLAGAALDVHEKEGDGLMSPLAHRPNVILTPHIGAMATESQEMIGHRAVELIEAHARGRLDRECTDEELLL